MHVRFYADTGEYVLVEATRLTDGTVKLHKVRESKPKRSKNMPPARKSGVVNRQFTPSDYVGLSSADTEARHTLLTDALLDIETTIARYPEAMFSIKSQYNGPGYQLGYKLTPGDTWVNLTAPTLQQLLEQYYASVAGGTV